MAGLCACEIERTQVAPGSVAIWWLAQAGFVFKTGTGSILYLDPYFTNAVEKAFGFKRLSLCPVDTDEVHLDWMINSHEHLDHLDVEALPIIAHNNPNCRFAGSETCQPEYAKCAIDADRTVCMAPGAAYDLGGVTVRPVRADHGDLSPSALSLLLDFGQVRVLFTGDTALRPDWLQPLLDRAPDVFLPCINGQFGNLDSSQAAQLTALVNPRLVIPCHYWMFMEHGGDPASFLKSCALACPQVSAKLLSPGEGILVSPLEISGVSSGC